MKYLVSAVDMPFEWFAQRNPLDVGLYDGAQILVTLSEEDLVLLKLKGVSRRLVEDVLRNQYVGNFRNPAPLTQERYDDLHRIYNIQ